MRPPIFSIFSPSFSNNRLFLACYYSFLGQEKDLLLDIGWLVL